MTIQRALINLLFLGYCLNTFAQRDTISTDRPGFSNTPHTVPGKHVQIESGWTSQVQGNIGITRRVFPDILVKTGLGDKTELRFSMQFFRDTYVWPESIGHVYSRQIERKEEGYEAPIIGIKRSLVRKEKHFLSLQADAVFNYLRSEYGLNSFWDGRRLEAQARCIYQYQSKGAYSLLHNTTYESHFNRLSMTFNNLISLSDRNTAFLELYLNNLYADWPESLDLIIDGGFTHLIRPHVQFDISAGFNVSQFNAPPIPNGGNVSNLSNHYFISAGFSALMH